MLCFTLPHFETHVACAGSALKISRCIAEPFMRLAQEGREERDLQRAHGGSAYSKKTGGSSAGLDCNKKIREKLPFQLPDGPAVVAVVMPFGWKDFT